MKKFLVLLLASFLVLTACGNKEESKTEDKKETKSEGKDKKKDNYPCSPNLLMTSAPSSVLAFSLISFCISVSLNPC